MKKLCTVLYFVIFISSYSYADKIIDISGNSTTGDFISFEEEYLLFQTKYQRSPSKFYYPSLSKVTMESGEIYLFNYIESSEDSLILKSVLDSGGDSSDAYYYRGQIAAKNNLSSSSPAVGGFLSGAIGGFIGWGIGYAINATNEIVIPNTYPLIEDFISRNKFERGYTEYIEKHRNRSFHKGAAYGTTLLIILLLAGSSS